MPKKRGTIREVAKLAGVNVSTVSRYLSGKLSVKPETEAAIQAAVQEVGYQPNLVARSLRKGATSSVAVVVPTLENPLFGEIVSGLVPIFEQSSYTYSVFPTMSRLENEQALCETLVQKRYDGAVFMNPPRDAGHEEEHILHLIDMGLKIVFLNRAFGTSTIPEVFSDHQFGTYLATSSLLKQGRHRIGLVLGRGVDYIDSIVKLRGYNQALFEVGYEIDENLIVEAKFTFEEAQRQVPRLIEQEVDGIICANDLMAAGAMKCIAERGLRVPEDIAVIGYGDTRLSLLTTPEISSVNQRSYELGHRAAEILLEFLSGERDYEDRVQACFPVCLCVRGSSAITWDDVNPVECTGTISEDHVETQSDKAKSS
ncbi:MAG: LacI family DNA-binding transcriptional regulator [Anaerolineae bacterium]